MIRAVGLIATVCAVATLAGCIAERARPTASGAEGDASVVDLYVVRRGWHVDVGFPVEELEPPLAATRTALPGATYILFGFGDRRYLMTRDENTCTGLAALWPGPGLLLVTGLPAPPAVAFSEKQSVRIRVTAAQARAAQAFIWAAIATHDGKAEPLASGPYDGSVYYEATPVYSGLHTCNTWAAEVLKAAGLPIRSRGVILAGQVWSQARRCAVDADAKSPHGLEPCGDASH